MNLETPKVGFVEAFKLYWTNYVNFKGRSRRSEYWWVMLWHLIITIPALFLGVVLMFIPVLGWIVAVILFLAIGLYGLATIIPNLALTVRRFHDVGFSMLIPILSFIVCLLDSKEQDNQYGPSPKYGRQYVGDDRNLGSMAYQQSHRNDTMTRQGEPRDIEETEKKDDPYLY